MLTYTATPTLVELVGVEKGFFELFIDKVDKAEEEKEDVLENGTKTRNVKETQEENEVWGKSKEYENTAVEKEETEKNSTRHKKVEKQKWKGFFYDVPSAQRGTKAMSNCLSSYKFLVFVSIMGHYFDNNVSVIY